MGLSRAIKLSTAREFVCEIVSVLFLLKWKKVTRFIFTIFCTWQFLLENHINIALIFEGWISKPKLFTYFFVGANDHIITFFCEWLKSLWSKSNAIFLMTHVFWHNFLLSWNWMNIWYDMSLAFNYTFCTFNPRGVEFV